MKNSQNLGDLGSPVATVVLNLEERNAIAQKVIQEYVVKHTGMDLLIGLAGLLPGGAIAALMTSIALQGPVIYQPMARKLAQIYLASPDDLVNANDDVIADQLIYNAAYDISANFGVEFLKPIAGELLIELGLGSAAAFIPIVGGIIAAGLDYKIAYNMTHRVGRMVAIYFQNGQNWIVDRNNTYNISKDLSEDLNEVRFIPDVRKAELKQIRIYIDLMKAGGMNDDQIRSVLRIKKVPENLINEALGSK